MEQIAEIRPETQNEPSTRWVILPADNARKLALGSTEYEKLFQTRTALRLCEQAIQTKPELMRVLKSRQEQLKDRLSMLEAAQTRVLVECAVFRLVLLPLDFRYQNDPKAQPVIDLEEYSQALNPAA